MNKIGIIITREFNERVRKKSFIITTILMPLLMIGLMVAPSLMMLFAKGEQSGEQYIRVGAVGQQAADLLHLSAVFQQGCALCLVQQLDHPTEASVCHAQHGGIVIGRFP